MNGVSRHPVIPSLIFSLACGAICYVALRMAGIVPNWTHAMPLVYFFLLTLGIHHWQERSLQTDPKGFVTRFMLGLMLKLFLSLILVVCILLFLPRPLALPLVLLIMFLYLAFLAFSTVRLVGLSRHNRTPQ